MSPTLAVIVLSTVICLRVPAQLSLQSARRLLVIDTYAIVVMCGLKIMLFAVLHSTCTIGLFITLKIINVKKQFPHFFVSDKLGQSFELNVHFTQFKKAYAHCTCSDTRRRTTQCIQYSTYHTYAS